MSKRTPLYDFHVQSGAQITDFYGWQMPVHYGSQINEHKAVRTDAGMFDVSHMTIVDLLGTGCRQFLRTLLCNDVDKLAHPGTAQYTCMLNHHGCILDDLITYYLSPAHYRLILNAATREKDLNWINQQASGHAVGVQVHNNLAMIAIQGPNAVEKTLNALSPDLMDGASTLQQFEAALINNWLLTRTGYTGEDGFEITLPADEAKDFWQALYDQGVTPCGLGARDTLRLEAGLLLYGQDMDEHVTPLESGLGFTVCWDASDRDFIGKGALELQKQQGAKSKLVGLILEDKGIMRSGYAVKIKGSTETGTITSGSFSPTLEKSIALARVPTTFKGECAVDIRGRDAIARIVKPRFVKNGQIIVKPL